MAEKGVEEQVLAMERLLLAVDRNVSNQYFAMEDEAVTMAEYQML